MESAFTAISQARIQSQVSYAVAAKAMDVAKDQGGAAIELLRSAAQVQAKAVTRAHEGMAAAMEQFASLLDENGRLDVTA